MGQNSAQQVVEVVRNPGGQHPQTLQFLVRHSLLLAALQLRDVDQYHGVADKPAIDETRIRGSSHPSILPVVSQKTVFDLVGTFFLNSSGNLLAQNSRVFGMNVPEPAVGRELIHGAPDEREEPLARIGELPFMAEYADSGWGGVRQGTKTMLAFPQYFLDAPPRLQFNLQLVVGIL